MKILNETRIPSGFLRRTRDIVLAACLLLTSAAVSAADSGRSAGAALTIEDEPRPLAAAIDRLQEQTGVVITYEDAPYTFEGDWADVTESVRKDLDQYARGSAPRVMIPRPGSLSVDLPEALGPGDVPGLLEALLESHDRAGNAGRFRYEGQGDLYHVVPVSTRGRDASWGEVGALLDTPVTLPEAERSVMETLRDTLAAVHQQTGAKLSFGLIPRRLAVGVTLVTGATDEPARDVLVRTLESTGLPLSWRLFYDPSMDGYFFNLSPVRPVEAVNPLEKTAGDGAGEGGIRLKGGD
ncbi:MAG: hypothetical protein AAGN66_01320 [Acidobacteriota bacterium]